MKSGCRITRTVLTGSVFIVSILRRRKRKGLSAALMLALQIVPAICMAQSQPQNDKSRSPERERPTKEARDVPSLKDSERAELLQIVRNLQDRVTRLESPIPDAGPTNTPDAKPQAPAVASG